MPKDSVPLADLRRALVIKLRHHGDVLLTSPVFSVLKAQAPQLEIDALVYADTAEMLTLHPAIAHVHTIDRAWKRRGPFGQAAAEWRLLRTLQARRYDLVVHLTEHPRGAWLARACGARWAVAPKVAGRGRWWTNAFTHVYPHPRGGRRHTVELNLDALRRIGVQPPAAARGLSLEPGAAARVRVDQLLAGHGLEAGAFIHVHPASRWTFKCWPAERMAQLIDRLAAQGHRVVLTGAPSDSERAMVEAILAVAGSAPLNLCGQLSLKEMAALTARARLFIGVDSAPMHIAAAVGTPVVALFGPSGEIDWGPWQVPARVVASTRHPCRPCGLDGCGGGKLSDCLAQLEVERVFAAAQELLGA
jgi:heptosyltransferase-3